MKKVTTYRVCDFCGSQDDVEAVVVRLPERRRERKRDVCKDCIATQPLKAWAEEMKNGPRKPGPPIRRKVFTEAEVEAAGQKPRRKVKR